MGHPVGFVGLDAHRGGPKLVTRSHRSLYFWVLNAPRAADPTRLNRRPEIPRLMRGVGSRIVQMGGTGVPERQGSGLRPGEDNSPPTTHTVPKWRPDLGRWHSADGESPFSWRLFWAGPSVGLPKCVSLPCCKPLANETPPPARSVLNGRPRPPPCPMQNVSGQW